MAELDLPAGAGLVMEMGAAFVPEPLPGFGALYGAVRAVRVGSDGQQVLGPDGNGELAIAVSAADWAGLRNRFWALLWRFDPSGTLTVEPGAPDQPRVLLAPGAGARVRVEAYGGPVEARRLAAADRVLDELLFAALWDWLRALCFGLLWLLSLIQGLGVASTGLAIVLLSVTVKLLMWPLTHIADRWQAEVNRTQARLQPRLDEIKRNFRGEEAHNLVLAAYREHGVHPLFTLKSLAGFLIQIPVFIAAFDMLGENFALNQAAFAWIDDLAKPDRLVALPFALPFFGGHLNLLPVLMTGFTLLASRLQADPDLTPALARQQRLRLYLMALVFFVLFYTFPAGMVLYWTTNNVLHLLKIVSGRILGRASLDSTT
jgi:YidC/Oxa1 family membrane protein insertase